MNEIRRRAWDAFIEPIRQERDAIATQIETVAGRVEDPAPLTAIVDELRRKPSPARRDMMRAVADSRGGHTVVFIAFGAEEDSLRGSNCPTVT